MGEVGILTIRNGNPGQGFYVTLEIRRDNNYLLEDIEGRLPDNRELEDLCTDYSQTFRWLTTQRGITDDNWQYEDIQIDLPTSEVDICSDLRDLSQQLQNSMTEWLQYSQDQGWNQILLKLANKLGNISDNFRLLIRSADSKLYKLPWHSWNLMQLNRNVEIAFSFLTNGGLESPQTNYRNNTKVRILAILGSSMGLDTEQDLNLLNQLNDNDAEVTPLRQPSPRELITRLRKPEGWDIFYFAGHSETNGEVGRIYIDENKFLEISEFQNSLQDANRYGLKIAIFNSCNGLGLAQQLAYLHIPFTIVMREPVPDTVAQSFLEHFLIEYSGGKSLYTSVRRAREMLEEFHHEFPGATSLPVIVQNPNQVSLTWRNLFDRQRQEKIVRKPDLSRIELTKSQECLEIVIPPKGFVKQGILNLYEFELCKICWSCFSILFGVFCFGYSIRSSFVYLFKTIWNTEPSGGLPDWLVFTPYAALLAWIVFVVFIKSPLCYIFVNILKVTLHHNRREFSVKYELFRRFKIRRGKSIPEDFLTTKDEREWLEYKFNMWLDSSLFREHGIKEDLPVSGSVIISWPCKFCHNLNDFLLEAERASLRDKLGL